MRQRYFPKAAIEFAAKTGFITKETWVDFFFEGGTIRWTNKLWELFLRRGYFLPYRNQRFRNVFVLNRRSPEVSNLMQGRIVRPPFSSQIDHDEIVARGALQATQAGLVHGWTTEAELKSFARDSFRIESQGHVLKYPDLIITAGRKEAPRPVAVEVELTQKARKRYVQILSAYSSMRSIAEVLFVTDAASIRQVIFDTARQVYFPLQTLSLRCVSVADWREASWAP